MPDALLTHMRPAYARTHARTNALTRDALPLRGYMAHSVTRTEGDEK